MSILPAGVAVTTMPSTLTHVSTAAQTGLTMTELLLLVAWAIIGQGVATLLGAFRGHLVIGPERLSNESSAWDLLVVLLGAYVVEMLAVSFGLRLIHLSPELKELAVGTLSKIASGAAIVFAITQFRFINVERVGMSIRKIGVGFAAGAVTLFILFPLIELTSAVVVYIYTRFHLEQADLHPVLQILGDSKSRSVTVLSIVLAVVVAPVSEELFFRAILQTALARFFAWGYAAVSRPAIDRQPAARDASVDQKSSETRILDYAIGPKSTLSPTVASQWLAILATAALFAAFHWQLAWFAPLLVLAVGLGYTYERTGNLWVNITTHALFNTAQILLYLTIR